MMLCESLEIGVYITTFIELLPQPILKCRLVLYDVCEGTYLLAGDEGDGIITE